MIDKLAACTFIIGLFFSVTAAAPATVAKGAESLSEKQFISNEENISFPKNGSNPTSNISFPISTNKSGPFAENTTTAIEKQNLQMTPASAMSSRRNKNSLFFCCTDDHFESVTEVARTGKQRERNTKPPILKRGKNPEVEEPYFQRRPALLLRFFPDGTAVLISKFQLHLHVKPKQIKFDSDEDLKPDDAIDLNPVLLNTDKSYEVTYKRLEAIPSSREQNLEELDRSDENNDVNGDNDIDHRDHEFITTTAASTSKITRPKNNRPSPLQSTTILPETTTSKATNSEKEFSFSHAMQISKEENVTPSIRESPFFIMSPEEMSSLQQQYEPAQASPLKATTEIRPEKKKVSTVVEDITSQSTPMPTTQQSSTETSETLAVIQTEPTTSTTKCLSFRHHLSLVLSTEDNIDNSLLKKHILPTQDCNTSDVKENNSLARVQALQDSVPETTTITHPTVQITTRTTPPSTTPYSKSSLVPYLASQLPNHASRPDVVVVTSLPVLIDLKSTRNQPVTDAPAWREVTVGVVRNQQGQPLKPRYNNWTAHLRSLRKKPEFWNEFTTPRTNFGDHSRAQIQQQFQPSSSQINRSFWTDSQRQRQTLEDNASRGRDRINSPSYLTSPPKNYQPSNRNDFHRWGNPAQNLNNRWNSNRNTPTDPSRNFVSNRGPLRSTQGAFHSQENRQTQRWNSENQRQNSRRLW